MTYRASPIFLFVTPYLLLACGHAGPQDAPLVDTSDASTLDVAPPVEASMFSADMFDDWEDGNRDVLAAGGRFGHWYNYDDATPGTNVIAVVALDPGSERHSTYRSVSKMALRVSSSGYEKWGSGFSADAAAGAPYDVSAYSGLVLWAKNLSPTPSAIRVVILDVNSDPRGGICDKNPDAPAERACYDAFGQNLDLTGEWQMYLLPFWALKQGGYGLKVPSGLDAHHIYNVAFANNAGVVYEYYLDDIGFYRE
jgi:hypothetical protein